MRCLLLAAIAAGVAAQTNGVQTTTQPILGTQIPSADAYAPSVTPNVDWPRAPNAQQLCPGYKASNVQQSSSGFAADLTLAGAPCNVYGNDIHDLTLAVSYQNATRLNVKIYPKYITPANHSLYILDDFLVPSGKVQGAYSANTSDLVLTWTNEPSFQFQVSRSTGGDPIFNTYGSVIVFEDQFLELVTTMVPDYNVYGLPEAIRDFRLGTDYTQTFWNQYNVMNDQPMDANMHCVHPIYVETRYGAGSSQSHAVFGRNMHGQEWLFRPTNLTYRAIGGSFDFYFLSGPTVKDALSQYQVGIVNTPTIQPYWALGFHQVRWGYQNWSVLQEVIDSYAAANIQLEGIWNDLDYMKEFRDFTNNPVAYPTEEGREFLARLHANGQYWMPILDPNIYAPNPTNASDANPPYNRLIASEAYLRNPDASPYYGIQWPGYSVFPDFLVPGSQAYWTNELKMWHDNLQYDGFWLDINDLSSWCTGSCGTGKLQNQPVHVPYGLPGEPNVVSFAYPEDFQITNASEAAIASSASISLMLAHPTPTTTIGTPVVGFTSPTAGVRNITFPPYALNLTLTGHSLEYWEVSPEASHNDEYNTTTYETHNLYGHLSGTASYNALLQVIPGKRPFFLSRSTSPGDGNITGHWGGDSNSRWGNMYMTISEALTFSIAGIPYFGVETCGFNGNADMELCTRWMELSAFFPLYRNHNSRPGNTIAQEAYVWANTAEGTRRAMDVRFKLLPYQYTLFWKANQRGETVMRAVQWEFPDDPSLAGVDNQFMLGPSILITPVLSPLATTVQGVFPGSEPWYDWYTYQQLSVQPGENKTIDAPLVHIPVHIRGGSIVPSQKPGNTTKTTRMNPWTFIVALDNGGAAYGDLYLDDGVSLVTPTKNVEFTYSNGTLKTAVSGDYVDSNPLANITIAGYKGRCAGISLAINGRRVDTGGVKIAQIKSTLYVTGLESATSSGAFAGDLTISFSHKDAGGWGGGWTK